MAIPLGTIIIKICGVSMDVFDGPRTDAASFKIFTNTQVDLQLYNHPDPITYPKVMRVCYNGQGISYVTNRAALPFGYHGAFIYDLINLLPANPVKFTCKLLEDSNHSPRGFDIEVTVIGLAVQKRDIEEFCNARGCAFNSLA
jgi:hypothetical protein